MKHILKGDLIDGVFLFSFLQAKMLQKYEKSLTKSMKESFPQLLHLEQKYMNL